MEKVKKQYGLWTGIAMVVGIVIGSGVFIKSGKVLLQTGGDLKLSILAWLVGGIIMICSGFCFAVYATKVSKYNGVVDYVEHATNKKIGYGLAWLITTFYYPIIASIVALFAGKYFFELIGLGETCHIASWQNYLFAFGVLVITCVINYYSPVIAGKFQVSATVIKLLPIIVIAVVGLFASLFIDGAPGIIEAFTDPCKVFLSDHDGNALTPPINIVANNFGEAVKVTAFAYEGWVCATAINAELKDSKKNLPRALVFGTIAVLVFYIIYFIGLSAILGNKGLLEAGNGETAPMAAFAAIMGNVGSKIFTAFIVISCLGTVNGLAISCCRGMYTMSCRGQGPAPEKFSKLGKNQSVSFLSCLYGFGCMVLMLIVWYLVMNTNSVFNYLGSMDEILCAIIYGVYILMYIYIMKNFKDCNIFQRFIMPIIAIIGAAFFVLCGTGVYQLIASGFQNWESIKAFGVFMVFFVILMAPCLFFYREDKYKEVSEN